MYDMSLTLCSYFACTGPCWGLGGPGYFQGHINEQHCCWTVSSEANARMFAFILTAANATTECWQPVCFKSALNWNTELLINNTWTIKTCSCLTYLIKWLIDLLIFVYRTIVRIPYGFTILNNNTRTASHHNIQLQKFKKKTSKDVQFQ